jgi:hypothetical protein
LPLEGREAGGNPKQRDNSTAHPAPLKEPPDASD